MSLLENLKTQVGKYSSIDPDWVQFVKDHRTAVRNNSVITLLSAEESFIFRYRPESYLYNKGMTISKCWIMLWINQINTLTDFKNLEYLLIPSDEYLQTLKRSYINYRASIAKL